MTLINHKIPIITGRNDVPTTSESEVNHPNGSFLISKYNALIDNLPNEITAHARQAISVTGTGSYDSLSGIINIPPNQFSFHKFNNITVSSLIQFFINTNPIFAFFDSQGNNLSSRITYNFFGLTVDYFEINNIQYLPNQFHTFPFGNIRVDSNEIFFDLNTLNFTNNILINFFIRLKDINDNSYSQLVYIIVDNNLNLPSFDSVGGSGS